MKIKMRLNLKSRKMDGLSLHSVPEWLEVREAMIEVSSGIGS